MQAKVTEQGVMIPKDLLPGVEAVEIVKDGDRIVVIPTEKQPLKTLEEIRTILREHLPKIQQKYPITEMAIFGSYAKGEQDEASDVDIFISYEKGFSLLDLVGLENDLSDLLGVKVDLVTKNGLKPHVKDRILSEAVYV